jgi:hypothetical protein
MSEFVEIIQEKGEQVNDLLDFIDNDAPHHYEKHPDCEILFEFGDDPTIYLKVNGKIGFAPLDWYRIHKRGLYKRYWEVRFNEK